MRKLCIIVTGLFCTLLFTTCKQYSADIEGDLSYWAAVVTARGVTCDKPSQINTSGVQCIPSATDVAFALKVRNPKNFTLVTPTSSADAVRVIRFPHLSPPPVYGTEYTLQQTASDTLTLVYKSGFLKAHERSRGNIGPEITFISTDGRVFSERFNLNIEANTPPPKPTAVLAQTNAVAPLQPTYVLCLQVPDMGISVSGGKLHGDIAQIEINGTSYPLTVSGGDFVKPTDAHFITNTSSPPTVTQLTGSASVPTGSWVLYYDTGLAVGQPYQAYTVKLKDNKGLVSETLETGTARPQLAAETVTVTRGEQGSGSGASDSTPIIINGAASAPETQITIAHGTPGTTVHCTVQEVVGGSVTGSVSPYNSNPVNVPLGLHGATEKLYKVEYHTEGTGYTPSSTTTKYYKVLKCYNVTFNANNGAFPGGLAQYTVRVPHGTFAAVPSGTNEPNKTGYHVDGWYTEAACTTQWNFSTQTITGDKQLYAKWAPNSGTSYRVEHYKEDLTENQYTSPPQIENPTGTTGASISVTHNNYPGFQVDRQDPPSATIAADDSTVVKVYYKRKTVNVTFNPNGGTISGSMANVTLSGRFGAALTPPSPVKTGYHLNPSSEWNPVSPAPALGSSPYIFPAANGTYQANWAPNTNTPYKVKHLKQDVTGSGYTEVTADAQNNLQGTTGAAPAVPLKTYTGFQAGSYTPTTIAADGSTVVEVKYDRVQYTVSFNANGGTPDPSTQSVRYEGTASTPSISKTGYTFGGWYKSSTYTGTAWNFASNTITANITLYAKWTANTYKVRFNSNGGSGSMNDQPFTYGTAQNLTANTFTKANYRFTGWATSSGSSTVVHTDQQSVNNLTTTNGGVVNLYAVWVPLPKVTFKVEGGKGGKLKCTYDGTTQEASGNTEKYFIVEYNTIKSAAFTAVPDSGWALAEWSINPGPFNDGSQSTALQRAVTRIGSDVIVTVKFYQTEISAGPYAWRDLKQAVKDAPAGKTIKINGIIQASSATGNNGEIEVTKNLSIKPTGSTATLDANNMSRIFKVTGGKFQLSSYMVLQNGNAGENEGGGIYVSGGELELLETTIKDCTAKDGGGIYLTGNGTKGSMYNTKILNNKAQKTGETTKGGGICIADSASFEMDGGSTFDSKIDGNVSTGGTSSSSYGGGVCVIGNSNNGGTHASFIFKKGTISNNTARYGGGVMTFQGGTFTMEGRGESYKDYDNNIIQGNTADASGGGVAVHGAMTMNGGSIKNNKAKDGGCGIFLWHSQPGQTTLTMTNGFITSNDVAPGGLENKGKGVFVRYTGLTMKMSGYARIVSTDDVYLTDGAKITVDSASFTPPSNNAATITPKYYNAGTQVLTGNYVGTHNGKFKVTPNAGTNWSVGSNGYLKTL